MTPDNLVEAVQSDRESADSLFAILGLALPAPGHVVERFAQGRVAALEEAARVAREAADQNDDTVIGKRINETALEIATAIEALKGSPR